MSTYTSEQVAIILERLLSMGWNSRHFDALSRVSSQQLREIEKVIGLREKILRVVGEPIKVPTQPEFTVTEEAMLKAGIVVIGKDFERIFMHMRVPATKETFLQQHSMEKESLTNLIVSELCDTAEVSFSQLLEFLSQKRDAIINLQTTDRSFAFYLRANNATLWAVDADWYPTKNGWDMAARSVSHIHTYSTSRQIVSLCL